MSEALLVALGAAAGAPLRYVVARLDGYVPSGMLAVNTVGSGLFGLFAALSLGEVAEQLHVARLEDLQGQGRAGEQHRPEGEERQPGHTPR